MTSPRIADSPLDSSLARRIAVLADCDPRTVVRVTVGAPVRPSSRRRILRALEREGLGHLVPPGPEAAAIASVRQPTASTADGEPG
jgi:hypothetical protein